MESLGSSALHRELQTKLPPLQFPGQMELRQDVIHQAPTARFSWLAWEGITWLWQQEESQQRPVARPYGAPGSGVPALCKPKAAHSSLLRRALLNLQPAVETSVPALHGWPQLIHSADPAAGSCKESCLVEAMLGCLWSWSLAAAPAAFTWQGGSSRASSSGSCSFCFGDAVLLCLWACHLTVFNGFSPFP